MKTLLLNTIKKHRAKLQFLSIWLIVSIAFVCLAHHLIYDDEMNFFKDERFAISIFLSCLIGIVVAWLLCLNDYSFCAKKLNQAQKQEGDTIKQKQNNKKFSPLSDSTTKFIFFLSFIGAVILTPCVVYTTQMASQMAFYKDIEQTRQETNISKDTQ